MQIKLSFAKEKIALPNIVLKASLVFEGTVLTGNDKHLLPRQERIWFLSRAEYKTEALSCRLKRKWGDKERECLRRQKVVSTLGSLFSLH